MRINDRFTPNASRFTLTSLWLVACGLWLGGSSACRLTDHDEGGHNEVTPADINIPASGYDPQDPADLPHMKFDSISLGMGRILQGAVVSKEFHFVNDGGGTLLITDVNGSCGCTVAKDWPHNPLKPGEHGTITVNFDSHGRSGRQEKVVTVVANTSPASTVLFIHGVVVAPDPTNADN